MDKPLSEPRLAGSSYHEQIPFWANWVRPSPGVADRHDGNRHLPEPISSVNTFALIKKRALELRCVHFANHVPMLELNAIERKKITA